MKEGRVFKVGSLDDGIDRAGLLAEATEDALGHVDVVLGRTARSVRPRLTLNLDSKGWARGFAKLASDASFLASGIPSQRMLTTEHGAERTLLPWIVKHVIRLKRRVDSEEENGPDKLRVEQLRIETFCNVGRFDLIG